MTSRAACIFVLLSLPCMHAWLLGVDEAALPTDPSPQIQKTWLTDDGLPHNAVCRFAVDGRGLAWLATDAGLVRFDGRNFRTFSPGPTSGVVDLAVSPVGTALVVVTADGRAYRFGDTGFAPHAVSSDFPGRSFVEVFIEPTGRHWFGCNDGTLVSWTPHDHHTYGPEVGIALERPGDRFSFTQDVDGRVWVAGGGFVGWTESTDGLVQLSGDFGSGLVVSRRRAGGVWIASRERLTIWQDGTGRTMAEGSDWPGSLSRVTAILEDPKGVLWVGTERHGLFRKSSGGFTKAGIPQPAITSIADDKVGNLWVTSRGGGFVRLRQQPFVMLDHEYGLPEEVSTAVTTDASGAVWCANRRGGLVRFSSGQVRVFPVRVEASRPMDVTLVASDPSGILWIASPSGLYRSHVDHPGQATRAGIPGRIAALFCARAGTLWIAMEDGRLASMTPEGLQWYSDENRNTAGPVSAMAEDDTGAVWFGTRRGELMRFENGGFVRIPVGSEDQMPRILAILPGLGEGTWLGTTQGLVHLRQGQARRFGPAEGLPDEVVHQVLDDGRGNLWCGCRRGLFRVSTEALFAVADGRARVVSPLLFGRDDGLEGAATFIGGQPMAARARDGWLWFATYRGVVGVDTTTVQSPSPPTALLDSVRVDGRTLVAGNEIVLPPAPQLISLQFLASNLSHSGRVRMRHQMSEHDSGWIETAEDQKAVYTRLSPGRHVLSVQARNRGGLWGEPGLSVVVVIPPAWWQTTWFVWGTSVIGLLGVVGIGYLIGRRVYAHRLRQLERDNALENERARIARNLHDELGSSLTQVGMLADRLARRTDKAGIGDELLHLARGARRAAGELENIVWTVNPDNDTWDRLAEHISQYAREYLQETPLSCEVVGAEVVPPTPVDVEVQHHLIALTKEALNNALKHSRGTQVTLTMCADAAEFLLEIRDNGAGFDPATTDLSECNGLSNMRSRMSEIGGLLTLTSNPGQGTTIRVRVALRS